MRYGMVWLVSTTQCRASIVHMVLKYIRICWQLRSGVLDLQICYQISTTWALSGWEWRGIFKVNMFHPRLHRNLKSGDHCDIYSSIDYSVCQNYTEYCYSPWEGHTFHCTMWHISLYCYTFSQIHLLKRTQASR